MFAYPKKLEEKKEEKKKRVETVTLSTTAKSKARLARKKAKEGGDKDDTAMDVDKEESVTEKGEEKNDDEKEKSEDKEKSDDAAEEAKDGEADGMEVDGEEVPAKKTKKKREPEPTSFRVTNPSRITLAQSDCCEFDLNQRYRPIRPEEKPFGVIILTDSTPDEEEDVGAVQAPSLEPEGECAPPEPFEWTPPDAPGAGGSGGRQGKCSGRRSYGGRSPRVASPNNSITQNCSKHNMHHFYYVTYFVCTRYSYDGECLLFRPRLLRAFSQNTTSKMRYRCFNSCPLYYNEL